MNISFNTYDLLLIIVVSLMGTMVSYFHSPKLKALILMIPLPFSIASLAVGEPVGVQNILGIPLLFFYTFMVYYFHCVLKFQIIFSIIFSAATYCLVSLLAVSFLPPSHGDGLFWASTLLVFGTASAMIYYLPVKKQAGYKSDLPIHVKFILIVLVVTCLVLMKNRMQGFITMFPMVGIVASYEGRKCLWTLVRQIPILAVMNIPLIITCYLIQPYYGLAGGLVFGWIVFLMILIPYILLIRKKWMETKHSEGIKASIEGHSISEKIPT